MPCSVGHARPGPTRWTSLSWTEVRRSLPGSARCVTWSTLGSVTAVTNGVVMDVTLSPVTLVTAMIKLDPSDFAHAYDTDSRGGGESDGGEEGDPQGPSCQDRVGQDGRCDS